MIIEDLRKAFLGEVPIEYKAHCQKRMLERNISRTDIANCIIHGEIIEDYPTEEINLFEASFSSCLTLGKDVKNDDALHVVVGYNGKKLSLFQLIVPT